MRTHYNMKITSLKKKLAKAETITDSAKARVTKHRNILSQSKDKVCKEFIAKELSKFIWEKKGDFKDAFYVDDEGETVSYAHNVAELLRSLADIVDSKNAEASALEDELEAKQEEFAQWTLKNTIDNTGLTKEQLRAMLNSL